MFFNQFCSLGKICYNSWRFFFLQNIAVVFTWNWLKQALWCSHVSRFSTLSVDPWPILASVWQEEVWGPHTFLEMHTRTLVIFGPHTQTHPYPRLLSLPSVHNEMYKPLPFPVAKQTGVTGLGSGNARTYSGPQCAWPLRKHDCGPQAYLKSTTAATVLPSACSGT